MKFKRFILSLFLLVSIFTVQVTPLDTFEKLGDKINDPMFLLLVSAGKIPGMSIVEKFGENPDVDTGGFEYIADIGGTYVPPTQARIHDVVSTLAADTGTLLSSGTATGGSNTYIIDTTATFIADGVVSGETLLNDTNVELGTIISVDSEIQLTVRMFSPASGKPGINNNVGDTYRVVTNASTGASIFWVSGQDATFLPLSEFVLLNGITNVPTIGSYSIQYRARVYGIGTTGAAGNVTSTARIDGTITCQVVNGNNQTLMGVFRIPINSSGYIFKWWGSLSKKVSAYSTIRMRIGTLAAIGYIIQSRSISSSGSSDFEYDNVWHYVPGGSDIWIEGDSSANDVGISAGFNILLVEN